MRIILLVILLYGLLFSLVSLVKSLFFKKVKKYSFIKRDTGDFIEIVEKEKDPKNYWKVNFVHFVIIIIFSYLIVYSVSL